MNNEYVIINKSLLKKRIEELESKIIPNPNFDSEIDSHNTISHNKSETVFGNYSGGPIESYEKGIEHVLNNMI
jgi:hypothetical protein